MKSESVLIVLPHLGVGGTEVQTFNIVSALISGGYTVCVLCLYRNIANVVKELERIGASVIIASPQYNNYDIKIKYHKGIELLLFLYNNLRSALKHCEPNIVHIQYMTPGATMILMLKYIFKHRNIIATTHTSADIYTRSGLKLIRFLVNKCLKCFQCITLEAEKEYFGNCQLYQKGLHIRPGAHFTIYNSLPPYISIANCPRSLTKNDVVTIGVVSRLEPIKGMDLVIPMFAKLVSKYNSVRLVVVGDGSQKQLMITQTAGFHIEDKVSFLGRKRPQELQRYYDMIDIILMPSRSEGFGLTAIEGMARGCVPMVSNVGGLPEVVNFDDRLLYYSEDTNDMLIKVESIVVSAQSINELSEKSIERARYFSKERFDDCLLDLYNNLK